MSPREDDKEKFRSIPGYPIIPQSPSAVRTALRLQELEAREGEERRRELERWTYEGPWTFDRWLEAYDAVQHWETHWDLLRQAYQLGLGPNLAIELGRMLDYEKMERTRIQPQMSLVRYWAWIIAGTALGIAIAHGIIWAVTR